MGRAASHRRLSRGASPDRELPLLRKRDLAPRACDHGCACGTAAAPWVLRGLCDQVVSLICFACDARRTFR